MVADDLRFALDVLQESSHLGLDSEHSSKLQALIQKQLRRREATVNRDREVAPAPSVDVHLVETT